MISEHALAVWAADVGASASAIHARVFEPEDGRVQDLGGGCGAGGKALATCAVDGNAAFVHRLRDAEPGTLAILVLGLSPLNFACGSCLLVPNPAAGLSVPAGAVDLFGRAEVRMPLPLAQLRGVQFLDQWTTLGANGVCPRIALDLSNAIRVTID